MLKGNLFKQRESSGWKHDASPAESGLGHLYEVHSPFAVFGRGDSVRAEDVRGPPPVVHHNAFEVVCEEPMVFQPLLSD